MSAEYEPSISTAKVLLSSRSTTDPRSPDLTTMELTFARSALAELNTHRAFSRNSASSRAIPVAKLLDMAKNEPYVPRWFSRTAKGMAPAEYIKPGDSEWINCLDWWLASRDSAVKSAIAGIKLGIHKQDVNRILEPFLMHKVILSSTTWENFFNLRTGLDENGNPLAYLPIYDLAVAMRSALEASEPQRLRLGQWHTPLIGFDGDETLSVRERIRVSIARVARTSYLTHDGIRDVSADLGLFDRLKKNGHWSPAEQVATPDKEGSGNFKGWLQYRWYLETNTGF